MTTFTFSIRTPNADLFNGEVSRVVVNTEGGDVECMANHASLTASVLFSPVEVEKTDGVKEVFMVRSGMFLFDNEANSATLLALHGEAQAEVSEQTVKEYLATIQKQLDEGKDLSEFQVLYLEGEKLAVEQQLATGEK